jgi:hypothetical protein
MVYRHFKGQKAPARRALVEKRAVVCYVETKEAKE